MMVWFQLFWIFVLFSKTAVDLYIGRIFAGSTGGGMYICLPLFVAEVADQRLVYVQYQRKPLAQS